MAVRRRKVKKRGNDVKYSQRNNGFGGELVDDPD